MMKRILLVSLLVWSLGVLFAGEFLVSSKLDSVRKDGYYKIQLRPELISFSKTDYSDIRLLNSKGEEVPFIFREEQPATSTTGFKEYALLENQYLENKKLTRVVVHNKEKKTISSLFLVIRNADIEKEITLKGSDNKQNWFIIQKGKPERTGKYNETAEVFRLDFPGSNYEYFELTTIDKNKDPIQFIKVGFYDLKVVQGLYAGVPVKGFVQKDSSDKKSYININFSGEYELNKLELKISGPEFYQRRSLIGNYKVYNTKTMFDVYSEFDITSAKPSVWETDKLKVHELVLIIYNQDNKPLKVEDVKAFQLNKYLIAELEKGESYYVKAGNKSLYAPEYDLKYFANNIPDTVATIHTNEFSTDSTEEPAGSREVFTKTVLWIVIFLVISLLAFLSIRVIKEMSRK